MRIDDESSRNTGPPGKQAARSGDRRAGPARHRFLLAALIIALIAILAAGQLGIDEPRLILQGNAYVDEFRNARYDSAFGATNAQLLHEVILSGKARLRTVRGWNIDGITNWSGEHVIDAEDHEVAGWMDAGPITDTHIDFYIAHSDEMLALVAAGDARETGRRTIRLYDHEIDLIGWTSTFDDFGEVTLWVSRRIR